MRILLTGATGFVGHHIATSLRLAGYEVHCAVRDVARAQRQLSGFTFVPIDFATATDAQAWLPHLRDIDAVINAVGVFRSSDTQSFAMLHTIAPCALFQACALKKIARVIQISALGAQQSSEFEFLESKFRADEYLLQQELSAVVLLPAPIFGRGGASTELFAKLALLPVLGWPVGAHSLQPVHIDDLCTAILRLLTGDAVRGRMAAVGPEIIGMRDYVSLLRSELGLRHARTFSVSPRLINVAYAISRSDWLAPKTQAMLQHNQIERGDTFHALLGRAPIPPGAFIDNAAHWRAHLLFNFCIVTLRHSIALLWLISGIVSLWVYPRADSLQLLERSGFTQPFATPLLYGAAALDITFGVATLFLRKNRRFLWLLQAALIVFYTLIISWRLPEFWAHPYGPVLKNLPILASILLLYFFDSKRKY